MASIARDPDHDPATRERLLEATLERGNALLTGFEDAHERMSDEIHALLRSARVALRG